MPIGKTSGGVPATGHCGPTIPVQGPKCTQLQRAPQTWPGAEQAYPKAARKQYAMATLIDGFAAVSVLLSKDKGQQYRYVTTSGNIIDLQIDHWPIGPREAGVLLLDPSGKLWQAGAPAGPLLPLPLSGSHKCLVIAPFL